MDTTAQPAWLAANRRRLVELRAEVKSWAGAEALRSPFGWGSRIDLDRTERLPTLAEIDLLAGHDPLRPPAGRVNIWAPPGWWTRSSRWRAKAPHDVPLLFRSQPGELVGLALATVDATHLAAALRSLDALPLWRHQRAALLSRFTGCADKLEAAGTVPGLSLATRSELDARARASRLLAEGAGGIEQIMPDGSRVSVRDALLAADCGSSPHERQSKEAAQRRFLVPTWNLLERRLGWGPKEWADVVADPAWIALCPEFLDGRGFLADKLRKAHARAADK